MPAQWTREHRDRIKRLLRDMQRACGPDLGMAPEEIKALPFARKMRVLFPHWLRSDDAPFHAEADARRNQGGMPMVDCWFRGGAKTTRYVILGTAIDVVERRHPSLVLGAKTQYAASEKANIIRTELRHNQRLRLVYGDDIEPVLGDDAETDWTACDCRVTCFGTGQSVRGALSASGYRPTCFRGDDLDDIRINRSREQQEKLSDWLWGDVYPALDDPSGSSVFHVVCNMYNRTCLANRARLRAQETDPSGRPLCEFHRYPALDDETGRSTWPARYTTEAILRAMAIVGPSRARSEYLCLAANDEAPFQPEWFKPFSVSGLAASQIAAMEKVAFFDPSATAKETSDYKAQIVLGRERGKPEIYCLHAWIRRATIETALRHLLDIREEFPGVRLAAEGNGFQALCLDLLRMICQAEGREAPHVRKVVNTTNKQDRILENQGEISQGLCFFDVRQGDQQLLVNQFCDLPAGRHDDGPDAWDGARRELGPIGGAAFAYRGYGREDRGALTGVGRGGRVPPRPGSPEDRFERQMGRGEHERVSAGSIW